MMKMKPQGFVLDLMPNIRFMQANGHFLLNYYSDAKKFMHKVYCNVALLAALMNFAFVFVNIIIEHKDVEQMTANTVTLFFFIHSVFKLIYVALRRKTYYKTMAIWNNPNSHPLFAESNARFHAIAMRKVRRLLYIVISVSVIATLCWIVLAVFEKPVRINFDKTTNETTITPLPKLVIRSWFPWNENQPVLHFLTLVFQTFVLFTSISVANTADSLFNSWLVFACEQICHLKEILTPLMELSATLDTVVPNSADLFKAGHTDHLQDSSEKEKSDALSEMDVRGLYSSSQDFAATYRGTVATTDGSGYGPNGLTRKQEMMVRSAIKYWVERHKHVVRLATAIGDTYGVALLVHMLVTTISLTLLAYQATKVNGINVYAFSTIGYLVFALGQVFHFCIYGNRLIEESSSVMEAAYSCHWYDGSEEAKTFIQIVCQQCQKALSISGAKFFTVSLDLFASVLGAVVTYFMVLVQLK